MRAGRRRHSSKRFATVWRCGGSPPRAMGRIKAEIPSRLANRCKRFTTVGRGFEPFATVRGFVGRRRRGARRARPKLTPASGTRKRPGRAVSLLPVACGAALKRFLRHRRKPARTRPGRLGAGYVPLGFRDDAERGSMARRLHRRMDHQVASAALLQPKTRWKNFHQPIGVIHSSCIL